MTGEDFWSRRRAAVQAEEEAEKRAAETVKKEARDAELAQRTDEEILQSLDLPDPDQLAEGDDFKAFFSEAVPERLRRRALRRLWRINPVLANLDGLVDYGEDFTDAATVVETLGTTYQVGRGMAEHLKRALATEAEAPEPDAEATAEGAAEKATDPPESSETDPASNTAQAQAEAERLARRDAETEEGEDTQRFSYARPPRMRYNFDNQRGNNS